MKFKSLLCIFSLLCFATANGQTLYDITFSQFTAGTVYTSANGGPNDFSSYATNYGGPFVSSQISSSFLDLTGTPLVCTTGLSSFGIFSMSMGNVSSSIVTLNMQLMFGSGVNALVQFNQGGIPGLNSSAFNATTLELFFNGDTMSISSDDGLSFSPTDLYSASTNFSRSDVLNIDFSLNTFAKEFSLTVNNIILATDAPIGSTLPINNVSIALGDIPTSGTTGQAGIDNIIVTASPIPEPSTVSFVILTMFFAMLFRRRGQRASIPRTQSQPRSVGALEGRRAHWNESRWRRW